MAQTMRGGSLYYERGNHPWVFSPGADGCKIVRFHPGDGAAIMTTMDGKTRIHRADGVFMNFTINRTGEEVGPDGTIHGLTEDSSLQLHNHNTVIGLLCDLFHLRVESEDERSITLVPNV